MLSDKAFHFITILKIAFLLSFLVLITSCGEDTCYFDIKIDKDGTSREERTKNLVVDSTNDNATATGAVIRKDVTVVVSGAVSMCNNIRQNTNLLSVCNARNEKFVCPLTVTQNNFTDRIRGRQRWDHSCLGAANRIDMETAPQHKVCENGQRPVFCDSQNQSYGIIAPDFQMPYIYPYPEGSCAEKQGYQHFSCDAENNEMVWFSDEGYTKRTVQKRTGRKCPSLDISISAQKKEWTEIANDVKEGDIVRFFISKPTNAVPNVLFNSKNVTYLNPTNTSINRWAQGRHQYADLFEENMDISKCPNSLHYSASTTDYKGCLQLQKGKKVIGDSESQESFWNMSGKGLVLTGVKTGECPTDNQCSTNYFSSTENRDIHNNFGVLFKLDENTINQVVIREFRPKQKFSKICAKICDKSGRYVDNLGGYTINAQQHSCNAFNGNPSPCCTDERGVLEYKFGNDGVWKSISKIPKFIDDKITEENFKLSYTGYEPKELFLRVKSDKNLRQLSIGSYAVSITYYEYITSPSGTISNVVEYVRNILKQIFFSSQDNKGVLESYFSSLSGNVPYLQYLRVLLLLYIILYGLAFIIGYVEISQKDLILRLLKIGIVLTLTQKEGYSFLYENFFKLFINGPDTLICKSNFVGSCSSENLAFAFANHTFALIFFNSATWLKLLALLVSSPIGIIMVIFIFMSILYFTIGLMAAIVTYLMCILAVSILIFISPIFIPFILFERTVSLFKSWLKLITRYALEPVLLIIGLQALVAIFYAIFKSIMNFTVCWKCMFPINLGAFSGMSTFLDSSVGKNLTTKIFCMPFFGPFGFYGAGGILFGSIGLFLPSVILLFVIAHLIKDYHSFITSMINNIAGGSAGLIGGKGGAASFVRDRLLRIPYFAGGKLNFSFAEAFVGNTFRKGIASAFDREIEDEVKKKEEELNETAKREIMRPVSSPYFKTDLDIRKFNDITKNLSKSDAARNLAKGGEEAKKAAGQLGKTMFQNLNTDKDAYNSFVSGMDALRKMDEGELGALVIKDPSKVGLLYMREVLDSKTGKKAFDDLTSDDGEIRSDAMNQLGKDIFMDKALSNTLLNEDTSSIFSENVFKLGRESRSKIK